MDIWRAPGRALGYTAFVPAVDLAAKRDRTAFRRQPDAAAIGIARSLESSEDELAYIGGRW